MKTTLTITALALGIIAPSLAAWLFAGQMFSPDILLGSYSITGLLFIAVADYVPRRSLIVPGRTSTTTACWTRHSQACSRRFGHSRRAERIAA